MGIQKFRFDKTGEPDANGAVPVYVSWIGGNELSGIRNCPCSDGVRRTVYIQGDADTLFSIPAAIAVRGHRVKGFVCKDIDGELEFVIQRQQTRERKSPQFVECGSCGNWHRAGFAGDCRDDAERFTAGQVEALTNGHDAQLSGE